MKSRFCDLNCPIRYPNLYPIHSVMDINAEFTEHISQNFYMDSRFRQNLWTYSHNLLANTFFALGNVCLITIHWTKAEFIPRAFYQSEFNNAAHVLNYFFVTYLIYSMKNVT